MLATGTQRKILRVLAEKNKRYTIQELAQMCHRSEAAVSRALRDAERYPFIKKDRVPESKQLIFSLDPEDRYTAPIHELFRTERERERQNGTIPVDIWNLLEDATENFSKTGTFIELFLYGSYATGEYHAGSDIDLLLAHRPDQKMSRKIDSIVQKLGDERIHVQNVEVRPPKGRPPKERAQALMDRIRKKAPVRGVDVLIPLSGEVAT